MNKRTLSALPILILLIVVSLGILFRSFVMDYVIAPSAFLVWGVWWIILSVDQYVYWIALIIVCAVLVAWLIISRKGKSPNRVYNYTYKPPSRVEHWRTLIEEAVLGKNEREQLRLITADLFISIIAQDKRAGPVTADEVRQIGKTSLPSATYQYLFPEARYHQKVSLNSLQNNLPFMPRWLQRLSIKHIRQSHTMMAEILTWMETELEIKDEG